MEQAQSPEDEVRIQLPNKKVLVGGLKVLLGSTAALIAILSGHGGCPPNMFCTFTLGYFMPISLFSLSMVLIAMVSLLSAFKDIFQNMERINIGQRDVESIAQRQNDDF
jgi:hypothetical protein